VPNWKRAFGYLDDTRQPDPVTAPLVKQAYAAVALRRLIFELMDLGLPIQPYYAGPARAGVRSSVPLGVIERGSFAHEAVGVAAGGFGIVGSQPIAPPLPVRTANPALVVHGELLRR
jgi:hypothetical protein